MPYNTSSVLIELSAVIVAVSNAGPQVMVGKDFALPSGPFATKHRTLEQGLRAWVTAQAGPSLGYVEQLYTFADKDRTDSKERIVSIGYLALTRNLDKVASVASWYGHLPWEDHREGHPPTYKPILQALKLWRNTAETAQEKQYRQDRIAVTFPEDRKNWNEELVLQRYELLWSAGLLVESRRQETSQPDDLATLSALTGLPLAADHRRILATGIARLRAKIKYRPVVFELMPDKFTLLQLQTTVEALAGLRLHKQNFRRLVQTQRLVEETTGTVLEKRGRPAQLYAFRRDVLRERAAAGTKLPRSG